MTLFPPICAIGGSNIIFIKGKTFGNESHGNYYETEPT